MLNGANVPLDQGPLNEDPGLDIGRTTIRLAIVHPDRLVRESIAFVMSRQVGLVAVASVERIGELTDRLDLLRPDVYVIDLGAPGDRGLDDARHVQCSVPAAKILMTGLGGTDAEIVACAEAGARGCLSAQASVDDLVENVRAVASGASICSPRVAGLLFSRVAQAARNREQRSVGDGPRITPREREIIDLINAGLSNKQIAIRLKIEVQTVKNHIHNILEKLNLEGRRDLRQIASGG